MEVLIIKILENYSIGVGENENVKFIRIEPINLSTTLNEIINSLSNLSWISQFDEDYIKLSYTKRAKDSATLLANKIKSANNDKITSDAGEYVVSELARKTIVNELKYLDIPLAELFKEQISGNPGFDYYSANHENILIFGEAKYSSTKNAYGVGLRQVVKFVNEAQDISDLNDIDKFFNKNTLNAVVSGDKAYSVAFATKKTSSEQIIKGIRENKHYVELLKYKELILVAVNI